METSRNKRLELICNSPYPVFLDQKVKRNKSDVSGLTRQLRELLSTLQNNQLTLTHHTQSSCDQSATWTDSVSNMADEKKVNSYFVDNLLKKQIHFEGKPRQFFLPENSYLVLVY